MIEYSLAQECEGEQKGSGATNRPAVSAWPVHLFPLGFSASNPITGADSLAYWTLRYQMMYEGLYKYV